MGLMVILFMLVTMVLGVAVAAGTVGAIVLGGIRLRRMFSSSASTTPLGTASLWWRWSPTRLADLRRRLSLASDQAQGAWRRAEQAGKVDGQLSRPPGRKGPRVPSSRDPWAEPLAEILSLIQETEAEVIRTQRQEFSVRQVRIAELEGQVGEVERLSERFCESMNARLARAGYAGRGRIVLDRLDALDQVAESLGGPEPLP